MFGLMNSIKRNNKVAKKLPIKRLVKPQPFPCYALPSLAYKKCECINKCKYGPSSPGQEILNLTNVFLQDKNFKIQL